MQSIITPLVRTPFMVVFITRVPSDESYVCCTTHNLVLHSQLRIGLSRGYCVSLPRTLEFERPHVTLHSAESTLDLSHNERTYLTLRSNTCLLQSTPCEILMPISIHFDYGRTRAGRFRAPLIQWSIDTEDPATGNMSAPGPSAPTTVGSGGTAAASASPSVATVNLGALLPKGAYALPEFSGAPAERSHAAAFLARVKRNFALQPGLTEDHMLLAVQNCFPLNSTAGSWFITKSASFSTFAEFEAAFSSRFGASEVDQSYNRRQFRRFKQRNSDTVTKFHTALLDLYSRIALSGNPPSEDELLEQFVDGLQPTLSDAVFKEQLRAGRKYSLDELVKLAEDIERAEGSKPRAPVSTGPRPNLNAIHSDKWCAYHKSKSHNTDDCQKVKALKAAGKWKASAGTKPDSSS